MTLKPTFKWNSSIMSWKIIFSILLCCNKRTGWAYYHWTNSLTTIIPENSAEPPHFNCLWTSFLTIITWCRISLNFHNTQNHLSAKLLRRRIPLKKVRLSSKHICLKTPSYKLAPQFFGLSSVIKQLNLVCYKLHIRTSLRIPNSFHVSLLVLSDSLPFHGPYAGFEEVLRYQEVQG